MKSILQILFSSFLGIVLLLPVSLSAQEKEVILLWPDGAPGAQGTEDKDKPALTVYPAPKDKNTGAAVVICPGGGYVNLAWEKEGTKFAEYFNSFGVNAFVLKYRLSTWNVRGYSYPAQFNDATRAMRLVRANAKTWRIDPARIGIMGFSAGGHLASTIATHYDDGDVDAHDPIERVSSRPSFAILGYPVISFTTEYSHRFSRKVLLGEDPDMELIEKFSNELQVNTMTPPTFLVHADNDGGVPPENSVLYYMALRDAGVPAELHIFGHGKHGFGLAEDDKELSIWPTLLKNWLQKNNFLLND